MKDEELFKVWKSEQYKDQSTEEKMEFVEHLHTFPKYFEQAFLAGLKARRPQWHDLRKNPNDLPEARPLNWVLAVYDNGILWCRARREKCVDGVYWVNSFHHVIGNVVMWAKIEIPTFDKE